jgi:hypothetical protein
VDAGFTVPMPTLALFPVPVWNSIEFPSVVLLVQRGRKSVVPPPLTGGWFELESVVAAFCASPPPLNRNTSTVTTANKRNAQISAPKFGFRTSTLNELFFIDSPLESKSVAIPGATGVFPGKFPP